MRYLLLTVLMLAGCTNTPPTIMVAVPRQAQQTMHLVVPVQAAPSPQKEDRSPVWGGMTKEQVVEIFDRMNKLEKAAETSRSAGKSPPVETRSPDDGLPVVTVYYPSWCLFCRQGAGLIMQASMNQEVVKFEFVTDERVFPDVLKQKTSWNNPVLYWQDPTSATGWRSQTGFTTLPALLQAMDAARQPKPQAASPVGPQAPQSAVVPLYTAAPARGNWQPLYYSGRLHAAYRWDGDLRTHLSVVHGYDASGLTDEQAIAYHDSLERQNEMAMQSMSSRQRRMVRRTGSF